MRLTRFLAVLGPLLSCMACSGCGRDPVPPEHRVGLDVELRIMEAERLMKAHRFPEAEEKLREALRLAPESIPIWYRVGEIQLHELHDPRAAGQTLRRVIELDSKSPKAHYCLGVALMQLGDYEGSSAEIQAALSLAPADADWRSLAENALVEAHLRQ